MEVKGEGAHASYDDTISTLSDLFGSLSLLPSLEYDMPADSMTHYDARYVDDGSSRDWIPLAKREILERLIGDMCQASHVPRFPGTRAAGTLHEIVNGLGSL